MTPMPQFIVTWAGHLTSPRGPKLPKCRKNCSHVGTTDYTHSFTHTTINKPNVKDYEYTFKLHHISFLEWECRSHLILALHIPASFQTEPRYT